MSPDAPAGPEAEQLAFESLLAGALLAEDPVAALARAAQDPRLSADLAHRLRTTDPDGFRMAALLVAKLRFERILRGRGTAAAWFARDPEGFTAVFRAYHHATPPTAFFPRDEADLFFDFVQRR